jgi:hypothetical protein
MHLLSDSEQPPMGRAHMETPLARSSVRIGARHVEALSQGLDAHAAGVEVTHGSKPNGG